MTLWQYKPAGISDNNGRIIFVWLGNSSLNGIGTYTIIYTPGAGDTWWGNFTSYFKLDKSFPGSLIVTSYSTQIGSVYNILMKSNGNIYLLWNAGFGQIYEYILPNNGAYNSWYARLSPTSNFNSLSMTWKYTYNFLCSLWCCLMNDKIIGIASFTMPAISILNGDITDTTIASNNYWNTFGSGKEVPWIPVIFKENT